METVGDWRQGMAACVVCVALMFGAQADPEALYDFGDAPEGPGLFYFTTLTHNGARHLVGSPFRIGALVDAEPDGLPSPGANGDDLDGINDEDEGLYWRTLLIPGSNAVLDVEAPAGGILNLWIDFDQNGDWYGEPEPALENAELEPGLNRLGIYIPPSALTGATYARFRLSSEPLSTHYGPAPDGEVVDQRLLISRLDFGDAPAPYPTLLADNGARHLLNPSVHLGERIDWEHDGHPSPLADGDDLSGGPNDEDGVTLLSPLYPGLNATLAVVASTSAYLQVWIDFNRDGIWNTVSERVAHDALLTAGTNVINFTVPATAIAGTSFLRARFSTQPGLTPTGVATDGEVEDHRVTIEPHPLDFGDAPPPYPTLLADNGARHRIVPGIHMGAGVDPEPDGQPSPHADGDDLNGMDDEDGVTLLNLWSPGGVGELEVAVPVAGFLQAWIDFNGDGDWDDPGEQVIIDAAITPPARGFAIPIPPTVTNAAVMARFRFSTSPRIGVRGLANDGEVEDHRIPMITADFGDAPAGDGFTYPVRLIDNGAHHAIVPGVMLGATVDAEPDGQPSLDAQGDGADEDGTTWLHPPRPGAPALVQVAVSTSGYLQVWVDWDRDGAWSAGEQALTDQALSAGVHLLALSAPPTASPGLTYARFRFSTQPGIGVGGFAPDGEVEDDAVTIMAPGPYLPDGGPCTAWLQRPNRTHGTAIQSWGVPLLGPANERVIRAADDWIADGRPVSHLRWWGSYLNWSGDPAAVPSGSRPTGFRITWYADDPDAVAFPQPGLALTNVIAGMLSYGNTNTYPGVVTERWVSTATLEFVSPDRREHLYEYFLPLPADWPVVAEGRYWLGVEARNAGIPSYRWAWGVAWPREGREAPAHLRRSSATVWTNLVYPPAVVPWDTLTNHPDAGRFVDLAFETLSGDCPRRASQRPTAVPPLPAGESAWYRLGDPPDTAARRADVLIPEGRRIIVARWQGTYRDWWPATPGTPTNPVAPPMAVPDRPLGFLLELYAGAPSPCRPGLLLTNLFVPLAACDEDYLDSAPQPWRPGSPWSHRYGYTVDLRDPAVSGIPWPLVSGADHWFSVLAIFDPAFDPATGGHAGWDWLVTDPHPACDAAVDADGTGNWFPATLGAHQEQPGAPHGLVFDLLTDVPGLGPLYDPPEFLRLDIDPDGRLHLFSQGDLGSGVQVLQLATNLVTGPWRDVQTNTWPRAAPATNEWPDLTPLPAPSIHLRIQQR